MRLCRKKVSIWFAYNNIKGSLQPEVKRWYVSATLLWWDKKQLHYRGMTEGFHDGFAVQQSKQTKRPNLVIGICKITKDRHFSFFVFSLLLRAETGKYGDPTKAPWPKFKCSNLVTMCNQAVKPSMMSALTWYQEIALTVLSGGTSQKCFSRCLSGISHSPSRISNLKTSARSDYSEKKQTNQKMLLGASSA